MAEPREPRVDPWGADRVFEESWRDPEDVFMPDEPSGWDAANDAAIDRVREERHFGV